MLSATPLLAALAALTSLAAGAAVPAPESATANQPQPSADAGSACQRGLYILTVGGTQCGEEFKQSCQVGHVAQQLVQAVPGSLQVTIGYDAVKGDSYSQSLLTGIRPLKRRIQHYAAACPDSRIVLMGYSRGAQVVADTLAGAGGDKTGEEPLSHELSKHVSAVIVWGDPSFNYQFEKAIAVGTARSHGTAARDQASCEILDGYSDRMRSFCDQHDMFCSPAGDPHKGVHASYFKPDHYVDDAVQFVQKVTKAGNSV